MTTDARFDDGERLRIYAARLLNDGTRAEDVVQEAALKIAAATATGENIANPRAWRYRVVRNLCVDILRKDAKLTFTDNPAAIADLLYAHPDDPAKILQQQEEREIMQTHLRNLPPRQAEALRLKFQEDLSYAEIAQIIGETVENTGWLLHTALTTLRQKFGVVKN